MLGEKIKYESLCKRKRELEEVAAVGQNNCGNFFARGATALREAMNNVETRTDASKLVYLREEEIDGFQEKCRTADPGITCAALLNGQYKTRVAMHGGKTEQARLSATNTNGGI
jgi:hypothetical protein